MIFHPFCGAETHTCRTPTSSHEPNKSDDGGKNWKKFFHPTPATHLPEGVTTTRRDMVSKSEVMQPFLLGLVSSEDQTRAGWGET